MIIFNTRLTGKNLKTLLIVILLNISLAAVALPPDMQADRYLVQVEKALKGKYKDYNKATEIMDKIMALKDQHNLELPIEFYFKYAKVLVRGETKPDKAFTAINHYLTTTGKSGANYSEALDLYNQAESQIEQNKLRAEQEVLKAKQEVEKQAEKAEFNRKCKLGLIKIGKYINHCNDGTVTDTETGLMWMRCSLGQKWNGKTCLGKPKPYNIYNSTHGTRYYIQNDGEFTGYSDWRTPTIQELNTLVYCSNGKQIKYRQIGYDDETYHDYKSKYSKKDYGCKSRSLGSFEKPTINQTVFPHSANYRHNENYEFGSSTPTPKSFSYTSNKIGSRKKWVTSFHKGYDSETGLENFYVRLVRDPQ